MEEDSEEGDSDTDVKEQASQKVRIVGGSGGRAVNWGYYCCCCYYYYLLWEFIPSIDLGYGP